LIVFDCFISQENGFPRLVHPNYGEGPEKALHNPRIIAVYPAPGYPFPLLIKSHLRRF